MSNFPRAKSISDWAFARRSMAFRPDALDFRFEGPVEAVAIDLFVFDERVLGDKGAKTLCVYEIIIHSVFFFSPRRTRGRAY